MSMTETAMDKYYRLPFRQDNMWLSGQIFHMEPETESSGMKHFSNRHLGFRILTTNPAHIP
jgi:hypothetical protein